MNWNKPLMIVASAVCLSSICLIGGCQPMNETTTEAEPAAESATPGDALAQSIAGQVTGTAPTGEIVKAEVGVGKKGRSLDNETGVGAVIVEPARQLFAFKEKAVFDIQIPQALQLFQATEGRKPESHDEFMAKIVKANNIKLPELPEGQTYVYDPQAGELMVQR